MSTEEGGEGELAHLQSDDESEDEVDEFNANTA